MHPSTLDAIDPHGFKWESIAACRILVIDDDKGVGVFLSRVLSRAGLTSVEVMADSAAGLARFAEQPPDLLLLDLHMPKLDGFGVLERLQALGPANCAVPVIVLTGDGDMVSKRRALAMGASDYLLKPFDPLEVVLRVRRLLQTYWLHRQLADQNRGLEAAVQKRTSEVEAGRLEMLERLAAAAELHDDETGQHTQRVGALSGQLAEALGMSPERVDIVRRAAPLHDLGKVGISDTLIRKPGPLNEEEFDRMRQHTVLGARILAGGQCELTRTAERIAHSHHEQWDGTGYPERLVGEAIPIEARLVAVVDFFDALTHDRPYRTALSPEQALHMIVARIGSHFDPEVAAAFVSLMTQRAVP